MCQGISIKLILAVENDKRNLISIEENDARSLKSEVIMVFRRGFHSFREICALPTMALNITPPERVTKSSIDRPSERETSLIVVWICHCDFTVPPCSWHQQEKDPFADTRHWDS